MTGGFADVGGLYDCLYGIWRGVAEDSILDRYSDIRRQKYLEVIDPISSGNLRRLWDPRAIEDDAFIKMVRKAETDKEFGRQMQQVSPKDRLGSGNAGVKLTADHSKGREGSHV